MAELITKGTRTAIKKMVQISQCARALSLIPTPEDFALRLIGDMRIVIRGVNNISTRINEILDRYSSIPSEYLLKGFDDILKKLNNVDEYTKLAIQETNDLMSAQVKSTQEMTDAIAGATSSMTSASLQIGGGLTSSTVALSANIKLAMTGDGKRKMINDEVQDDIDGNEEGAGDLDDITKSIRDWAETSATNGTEKNDSGFEKTGEGLNNAVEWIDKQKNGANEFVDDTVDDLKEQYDNTKREVEEKIQEVVDDTIDDLKEKVENAKREVEEKIQRVRDTFKKFTKDFEDAFGFINGKNFAEDMVRNVSNVANKMDNSVGDELMEVTGEAANFIKNFNIGKVVTSLGGIVVGIGAASVAMDLLPSIDADKMLKDIIGGYDDKYLEKMTKLQKKYESDPDLLEVPDAPCRLSKDDFEKYNADGYNKYLEEYAEENDKERSEILKKMQTYFSNATSRAESKEVYKENKSALKAMRKVRRDTIKARQIERYKGFLSIELDNLKKECVAMKTNIKTDWDTMMAQYKAAIAEINKFFSNEGSGGSEVIDKCCDRINKDATEIVELCQSLPIQLSSTVSKVPCPYAVGFCCDMPVHKILSFLVDLKTIITFLKNLIRLSLDIIAQIIIIIKLIYGGLKSLADMLKKLKDLLGIDNILNSVDNITSLFKPKLAEAKILMENSISPIYYNETEDYERRVSEIEAALDKFDKNNDSNENKENVINVKISEFNSTDDKYAKNKETYGGETTDEEKLETWLEELEEKGDNEIVAYRSPILNDTGDDFAGWIFYHAYAYDYMKKGWNASRKRRRNRVIKKASKKNKLSKGKLIGGVAQLKKDKSFGYYKGTNYVGNSVTGFDAYYWYTKWTNDPMDCVPDFDNVEFVYDKDGNLVYNENFNSNTVSTIQTTANGSLVEVNDGNKTMRVFVEGKIVKSGDFVNVNGVKYRVK